MSGSFPTRRGGRVRTACDLCRQRKIRCDNAKPACETCRLASVPCIFTQSSPPPQRKDTKTRLAEAEAQIRELEALLAAQNSSTKSHQSDRSNDSACPEYFPPQNLAADYLPDLYDCDTALGMFQWHIAHCGIGTSQSAQRASFSVVVHQQTGSHLDIDRLLYHLSQSFKLQAPVESKRTISQKWPPIDLIQRCVHHFSKAGLYSVFPVVNTQAVKKLLDSNILNSPLNSTPTANAACLIALTAMVTQMHRLEPAFADADPDAYMQTVLTLLPRILMEGIGLRTLETVVILFMYILPIGQASSAASLLAIAVRMLYSLGGNRYCVIHEAEGRHLRALFWLCYGLDKDMAIRFGHPPLMKDDDCDLQLPDNYVLSSSDHQFFIKALSSQELLFPSDIRLSLIKSKVYHLLYSDYGRGQPEARRLQYIRELDQELLDLKSSFPDSCWPDLFATENARNYTFHDLSLRGVNLHLEYYFCLGKIHGAVSACSQLSPQEWSFLPSSAELFYQESRSMLLYIYRIRDFLNWHTFWIHAQFILTAVLSLFRHLITDPNASTFGSDLQLLGNVVEIFTDLDHESRATRRFAPFSFTAGLTRRLIFLAKQAASKAHADP